MKSSKINWNAISSISNIILTVCTLFAVIIAIKTANIANRSANIANDGVNIAREEVKIQNEFYKLETTPHATMLMSFSGANSVYANNKMEIFLVDFQKSPKIKIEFYNEGKVPVMIGSVSVVSNCIEHTYSNDNGYYGISVLGDRRVIQPFEYITYDSINLMPYLNLSKMPCELNFSAGIQNNAKLFYTIILK